ncbi:MAG: hypothetical protein HY329_12500 [Chloroflexi bacterium]|nr:hypothetical protein [Chloroflexota bacterium]
MSTTWLRSGRRSARIWLNAVVAMLLLTSLACGAAPPSPASKPAPACGGAAPTGGAGSGQAAGAPAKPADPATKPAAPAAAAPDAQQSLTVGLTQVTRNMDPKSTTAVNDYNQLRLVYDTLVSVDSGKPEPFLAESWSTSDPQTWRFKLRQGVKFHNGEDFDAEAVRFTVQRALDDAKNPWRARIEAIEKITVIDKQTIEFATKTPVANLPTRFSIVWIVPPKYAQEKGEAGLASAPVGTGPFIAKEYQPNVTMTLEANPNWWGGAPKIKTLKLRPIPEASTRIAALQAGEVDVIYNVLPEQIDTLKNKGFQIISAPVAISTNVFFQQVQDSPVKDARVRQAIDFAIDKNAMLQSLTGGYGGVLEGQLVGKNSVGYNPNLKARPYDPAKAKQLLAEAGHPNGFTITMDSPQGRYYRDKDVAEAVQGFLSQVGIKVQLNPLQAGVWLDKLYSGTWGPMNLWSIQDAPAYDLAFTMELFRKGNVRKIAADDKFDELHLKTFTTLDPAERDKAYRELSQYIFDQAFIVPIYHEPGLYAASPKVRDVTFLPSTYMEVKKAYVAAQ